MTVRLCTPNAARSRAALFRRFTIAFLLFATSAGCVSQQVLAAVQAYSTAAKQVADSGKEDVARCQSASDPKMKQQFCDKAVKQFQTISDSATQLQNVK